MPHVGPRTLSALLAALLLVGGTSAPAFAAEPEPAAPIEVGDPNEVGDSIELGDPVAAGDPIEVGDPIAAGDAITLEGTLVVYSSPRTVAGTEPTELITEQVRVQTPSGGSVEITGPLVEGAVSGSDFVGSVTVQDADVETLNRALETAQAETGTLAAPGGAPGTLGEEVASASSEADVALTVLSARITAPAVEAAQSMRAHTVDVAVLSARNWPSAFVPSESNVNSMVSTIDGYWRGQSGGQVTGISKPLGVKYLTVPDPCAIFDSWDQSLAAFGDPSGASYLSGSGARHLLVLAPQECEPYVGLGLGSVGSLHSGGVTWASYDAASGAETVAHEFGHNLGLGHSNVHYCAGQRVESVPGTNGCYDEEYDDAYDLMGASFTFNGQSNAQIPALNVTHKERLGSLGSADLVSVKRSGSFGSTVKSYTLNPASATSGLRGLRVTDPATNEVYFVEYRSGTGIDAGALYTLGFSGQLVPGVRVLRLRGDASSAVLTAPATAGLPGVRPFAVAAGRSLALPSGALRITVNSAGSTANVTVSLGTGPVAPKVSRISGPDRYATAVEISKAGFPGTAPVVYLATGENYPDALSAAPAATVEGGPLLLTPSGILPATVKAEIQRLKPAKIVVVGNTPSISAAVFADVKKLAPTTVRLAGADRFETSRLVIAHAFRSATPAVYVATGLNYPDALSAAAAAGSQGKPVLLVNGNAGGLDAATSTMLRQKKVTSATIAGSAASVSSGIEASLRTLGSVKRLGGIDRFETSQLLNRDAFTTAPQVYLATGLQFPDALAGAALAGAKAAPLYVVLPSCVPGAMLNDLTAFGTSSVTLFGGEPSLNPGVAALTRC